MNFTVRANHRKKIKEGERRDKYLDLARELKNAVKHDDNINTNCNWNTWNDPQRRGKETVERRLNFEIDQNTEKTPTDPRRLAVSRIPQVIAGVKSSTGVLVRYSGPFLKWTKDELKKMDQRTRKLMTVYEALYPRDDVDRLYVSRKE